MKKFKLEINGNIQILEGEVFYKSNLQDVTESYILIDIPVNNGIYLTMNDNDEIEAEHYVDGGSYYKFNCRVLGRTREGKLNLYKLSKPYNISKIQRRNYVRVDMVEYAFYKLQNDNGEETYNKLKRAVEKFLTIKVNYLGSISEDRKLVEGVRAQVPFTILHPKCDASKSIERISNKLIGNASVENMGAEGLFKKLFSLFS